MRNTIGGALLWAAAGGLIPASVPAATIVAFSGEGTVTASPCSPTQTDPAACFALADSTDLYSVDGVSGYTFVFNGALVPNPDPDAFPFPTYVGTGTFSLTRGPDALSGIWKNVFFPAPPPPDCDAAAPFADPDCWTAESFALFDYSVEAGAGVHAGLGGTGSSRTDVLTGFPPGNVGPAGQSPYTESGQFVLQAVPEPATLGLLALALLGGRIAHAKRHR
jgi:hypothetical protein